MAVAYGNVSNTTSLNSNVVITKPSGLAVDDLMVALLSSNGAGTSQTWSLSGWTSLYNTGTNGGGLSGSFQILWKVATSSDVASSDFSFSPNAGGGNQMGTIFYATGAKGQAPTYNQLSSENTQTVNTTGLTPTANSLLVIGAMINDNEASSVTVSGYAIVTSNPTWTERLDTFDASRDSGHAFATAVRSQSTATGNTTTTASDATPDIHHSFILSIEDNPELSVSAPLLTITNTFYAPTLTLIDPVTVSAPLFNITNTFYAPSLQIGIWSNQSKNTATWSAQTKNTVTWTNQDKT